MNPSADDPPNSPGYDDALDIAASIDDYYEHSGESGDGEEVADGDAF